MILNEKFNYRLQFEVIVDFAAAVRQRRRSSTFQRGQVAFSARKIPCFTLRHPRIIPESFQTFQCHPISHDTLSQARSQDLSQRTATSSGKQFWCCWCWHVSIPSRKFSVRAPGTLSELGRGGSVGIRRSDDTCTRAHDGSQLKGEDRKTS